MRFRICEQKVWPVSKVRSLPSDKLRFPQVEYKNGIQYVRYDARISPGTHIDWLDSIVAHRTLLFKPKFMNHVKVQPPEVFTLFEIAQITVRLWTVNSKLIVTASEIRIE